MQTSLPPEMLSAPIAPKHYINCLTPLPEGIDSVEFGQRVMQYIHAIETNEQSNGEIKKLSEQQKKPIVGNILELAMAEMLLMHKVTPFYMQAEVLHAPNSKFDFLCYHKTKPVIFSTKVSLGERWRQVAFEGDSLKRVYRNAKCYLVSGDTKKTQKINAAIEAGEIFGIDHCLLFDSVELSELLAELSQQIFTKPEDVNPLVAATYCVTN